MTVDDIVKVTQYLTSAEDIADYAKVRYKFLEMRGRFSCCLLFRSMSGRRFLWKSK